MSRFDSIPNNAYFKTLDGEQFKKISAQVYIDPLTGIETYWDPMFDGKIVLPVLPGSTPEGTGGDKFAVDPQTRVVTPNPQHYPAEQALTDLYGSGYFDCEASDYRAIVETCLKWGKGRKRAKKQQPYSGPVTQR